MQPHPQATAAAIDSQISAAQNPPFAFLPLTLPVIEGFREGCEIINDWATKKGWNEGVDAPEKISVNRTIAVLSAAILGICELIEQARKGQSVSSDILDATEAFIWGKHWDFIHDTATPSELHTLAQLGLMHTEIAEASEAVLTDKTFDDHLPDLGAVPAELADTVIRILHFCGQRSLDLGRAIAIKHDYNTKRPYRHGKLA